ncbi:pelota like protein [Babesia gibsoni]|uniref:Eukaryotic peptide chain release factor subunit 1 n=1 Tax=Babesia gibsoni TaxID=33632 RepID=A0AAD8PG45_BABGI|nr:pelota like protein [Babesia gibsoni]
MQIHKKSHLPNGGIVLSLTAENPDDIWCIYNLLSEGDEIVAFTSRKVKKENSNATSVKQEIKKFNIHLAIEKITYASSDDDLQVSGKNISDNPYVKIGQYHTAEIRTHSKITLTKNNWNSYYNDKLNEITNFKNQAEQIFLVLDSAVENFFKAVIKKINDVINFEVTRSVVITGPGFTKNGFFDYLKENCSKLGYDTLNKNLKSFIVCNSTSSDQRAISEVLANQSFAAKINDQLYVQHNKAIEILRKRLEDNEDTIAIGVEDVLRAIELGAVDAIIITEDLIRHGLTERRKQIHKLIEDAKSQGGKVYYLSDKHFSSEFIKNLTGIAALLRLAIDDYR